MPSCWYDARGFYDGSEISWDVPIFNPHLFRCELTYLCGKISFNGILADASDELARKIPRGLGSREYSQFRRLEASKKMAAITKEAMSRDPTLSLIYPHVYVGVSSTFGWTLAPSYHIPRCPVPILCWRRVPRQRDHSFGSICPETRP